MGSPATFEYKREPYLIVFKEEQPIKETYAGQVGTVVIEAQRLCPENAHAECPSCAARC